MIYLHKNGVTIVADKKAKVGQTYELNGEKYLVVNRKMLENLVKADEDVTKVVTTRVKMMLCLFQHKTNFNQDISSWDVSNVTNMNSMFLNAISFNQDLSVWNVDNVTSCQWFNVKYDYLDYSGNKSLLSTWTLPKPSFSQCNIGL